MPQVSAAVLRSTPSSTSASASIRRAAALFFSPLAALRSSEAVRSSRVIDTAAPIDAAPLKGQHRVRVSLIWESPMSHSFGPLVLSGKTSRELFRIKGRNNGISVADVIPWLVLRFCWRSSPERLPTAESHMRAHYIGTVYWHYLTGTVLALGCT